MLKVVDCFSSSGEFLLPFHSFEIEAQSGRQKMSLKLPRASSV